MIKSVMEVNKKVGAGAQKNGLAVGRVGGLDGAAEQLAQGPAGRGGQVEQIKRLGGGLVGRLMVDYPELRFRVGKRFMFRPPRTVVVRAEPVVGGFAEGLVEGDLAERAEGGDLATWRMELLHEVGHAALGHRDFRTDPERLAMEREAWEQARRLAAIYNIDYDKELAEAELDTYRDWLHQRSRCPECGLTRYQTRDGRYHCPGCDK